MGIKKKMQLNYSDRNHNAFLRFLVVRVHISVRQRKINLKSTCLSDVSCWDVLSLASGNNQPSNVDLAGLTPRPLPIDMRPV